MLPHPVSADARVRTDLCVHRRICSIQRGVHSKDGVSVSIINCTAVRNADDATTMQNDQSNSSTVCYYHSKTIATTTTTTLQYDDSGALYRAY